MSGARGTGAGRSGTGTKAKAGTNSGVGGSGRSGTGAKAKADGSGGAGSGARANSGVGAKAKAGANSAVGAKAGSGVNSGAKAKAGTNSGVGANPRVGLKTWLLAIRPATLPASVSGVIVGLGAARATGAVFRVDTALGCMAVALLLQIAANLANDMSDFKKGADTPDRLGPTRVAAAGLVTVRQLQAAIVVVLVTAAVVGGYLAFVGGPALLVLGAAAIVGALAYTGGPLPYGYRGLGEVFVFIFFGLVAVVGTAELQSGRLEPLYFLAAIPVGTLTTAILVINNLRDTDTDRAAGKRTLAVTFGKGFARAEYVACLVAAWAVPIGLLVAKLAGAAVPVGPALLLTLIALPLAIPLTRIVYSAGDPRRLNPVLRITARLTLIFSLLFAAGLAVGH